MLKAINVTKTYNAGKKVALNNFSIEVPKGSIYGLLGPNGAGKTSFIRIINQITQPDSGEVFINNQKLSPEHIKEIGYMPEERGLYKNMTIGDQLTYFGELKGMSRNDAITQAKYWFEQLNIDQWWKKKLSELSKGMAQKIQFVVTVLHQPKLLILDEPFSGFDPVNANLIKDKIIELKEKGTTIILSTHRMESVEEMCDYVALINQSNKVLDGKVFDVREQFKQNIFNVVLADLQAENFERFSLKYTPDNIVQENGLTSFQIRNESNNNVLLEELLQTGRIRVFEEKIPSMNEVFINAVQ
ncbi:ATP-binding cassette domain-containing protein [Elizabethkingia meningoseptica]|uniref:ABC transporter ATP-binding protein n=1 Tax=Elizabethkingia meningoseptica TaxID=238 RepID=UPI0023B1432B|nr:ATP-binding cassette domain-containing protein [Elizabethkingia meningoseptica]MDE5437420.1 ATP-binding cassette domain-containing protein [Elizabethkingia meningoseptica]MDE5507482.1 ATP-binding cassette domain-containing protein [Elizabethkingia meningoseptica]MDE5515236.1 ATP-binding cassette domain-containing protein [Elizabethkingia meningoseptica]MDE5529502.1 ATP-binding cassette domain-containing protein [Elizabethkingia meningoseptica]MDE5533058.1 ATP-binding cassette domain-contain